MKRYELQPTDLKTAGGPTEERKASDLETEVKCDPTFEPTRFVMTPDSVHNDFAERGFDQALMLWIWFQQIGQAHYLPAKGKNPAQFVCAVSLTHAEILERYPKKGRSRKWLSDRLKEIGEVTGLYCPKCGERL